MCSRLLHVSHLIRRTFFPRAISIYGVLPYSVILIPLHGGIVGSFFLFALWSAESLRVRHPTVSRFLPPNHLLTLVFSRASFSLMHLYSALFLTQSQANPVGPLLLLVSSISVYHSAIFFMSRPQSIVSFTTYTLAFL